MSRTVPDKAAIRALASPQSFERGRDYLRAVSGLVGRGEVVTAEVEGSDVAPYRVTIRLDEGRIAQARCTCPYEWGGACKHVVAVLLRLAEAPEKIEERPTLRALLKPLGRDALVDLIVRRADHDPDFAGWLETERATAAPPGGGAAIDPAPIKARARAVLAGRYRRDDYWQGYRAHGNPEALRELVGTATPFLEKGDARNALRILEAVTDSFVEDWLDFADTDEDMYALFNDLAAMMAEAALMGDLSEDERSSYADALEDWRDTLSDHGVGDWFAIAAHAMRAGWDDPALQAAMAGEGGAWPPYAQMTDEVRGEARGRDRDGASEADELDEDGWDDDFADGDFADGDFADGDLADAADAERFLLDVRLRVLEASGQSEAYLNLARAAGAPLQRATYLVRLGRVEEAVAEGRERLRRPGEVLSLARALMAAGHRDPALAIAETGLDAPTPEDEPWHPGRNPAELAQWLRDQAVAAGRTDLALKAALVAFRSTLAREDYRAIPPLAGAAWERERRACLAHLIAARRAPERVAILLDEGMVEEAVASVGEARDHSTSEEMLLRLLEAAHASHSDWVIRIAEARAGEIMESGSAGLYDRAAEWLRRAALAYDAAGCFEEWSARLEGLIERHRRKYKLRPLLEGLR